MICSFKSSQCFWLIFFTILPVTPFMLHFTHNQVLNFSHMDCFPPSPPSFYLSKTCWKEKDAFLSLKDSNHHKHCCSSLANSELCLLSLRTWSFKSDWAVSSSRLQDFTSACCFRPDWADLEHLYCAFPVTKTSKDVQILHDVRPWEDIFLTVDQIMEDSVWHLQDHPSKITIRASNSFGGQPFSSGQKPCTSGSIHFRSVQFHPAFKTSQFWTQPQEQLVPLAGGWLTG